MTNIPVVAGHEFFRLARSPLVVFVVAIIAVSTLINAAGCSVLLPGIEGVADEPFMSGIGNLFYFSSIFFSFLAVCVGIMSIAGDRSTGNLKVLMTKPLHGRDVIAGKVLGMNALLLVLVSLFIVLGTGSLAVAYGMPRDTSATAVKVAIFWAGLFLLCSLVTGIMAFIGVIIRDLTGALAIAVSAMVIAWFARLQYVYEAIGKLELLNPIVQYTRISAPSSGFDIFNPYGGTFAFPDWLGAALPYILLVVAEILALFTASCILFKDEVQ